MGGSEFYAYIDKNDLTAKFSHEALADFLRDRGLIVLPEDINTMLLEWQMKKQREASELHS